MAVTNASTTRLAPAHALSVLIPLALVPLHPALARWPLPLLWPLGIYAVITLAIRPLRQSVFWLRVGSLDRETLTATGLISPRLARSEIARYTRDDEQFDMLVDLTARLGGALADPLKTTVVQDMRSMTTWVVRKATT